MYCSQYQNLIQALIPQAQDIERQFTKTVQAHASLHHKLSQQEKEIASLHQCHMQNSTAVKSCTAEPDLIQRLLDEMASERSHFQTQLKKHKSKSSEYKKQLQSLSLENAILKRQSLDPAPNYRALDAEEIQVVPINRLLLEEDFFLL